MQFSMLRVTDDRKANATLICFIAINKHRNQFCYSKQNEITFRVNWYLIADVRFNFWNLLHKNVSFTPIITRMKMETILCVHARSDFHTMIISVSMPDRISVALQYSTPQNIFASRECAETNPTLVVASSPVANKWTGITFVRFIRARREILRRLLRDLRTLITFHRCHLLRSISNSSRTETGTMTSTTA